MNNSLGSVPEIPLTISQGETFVLPITFTESDESPIDLTLYTARMQIRESPLASAVLLNLATAGSGIVLGGTLGTIQITITSIQTLALPIGIWSYDLFILDSSLNATKLMYGPAEVVPSSTSLS